MRHLFVAALVLLAGCDERFRYACQDPAKWDAPACKRPICSSSYTCPDQLASPEILKTEGEVR